MQGVAAGAVRWARSPSRRRCPKAKRSFAGDIEVQRRARARSRAATLTSPHGQRTQPRSTSVMPFIRIFGLINAFVVENVRQQRELERHEHVSAILSSEGGLVHRVLASRFARD